MGTSHLQEIEMAPRAFGLTAAARPAIRAIRQRRNAALHVVPKPAAANDTTQADGADDDTMKADGAGDQSTKAVGDEDETDPEFEATRVDLTNRIQKYDQEFLLKVFYRMDALDTEGVVKLFREAWMEFEDSPDVCLWLGIDGVDNKPNLLAGESTSSWEDESDLVYEAARAEVTKQVLNCNQDFLTKVFDRMDALDTEGVIKLFRPAGIR